MSLSVRLSSLILLGLGFACTGASATDLTVVVSDLQGHRLQDAVVYATKTGTSARAPLQQARASIDQVNRQFVPLVTVLRAGTEVSFPNSDNIRHSIYSFSQAKTFTTKLYSGTQASPVVFDRPGLVTLGCNIHDAMAAWVVVVDTPNFGKTGAEGTVVLGGLEAGDYQLSVWYPGSQSDPQVLELHVESQPLRRELSVDASGSPLPELRARVPVK